MLFIRCKTCRKPLDGYSGEGLIGNGLGWHYHHHERPVDDHPAVPILWVDKACQK